MRFPYPHNSEIEARLNEYLRRLKARKYSPRTLDAYYRALRPFFLFLAARGIERLQDVTLEDLEKYRLHLATECNYSHNTVYDWLRNMRAFFNFLEAEQHIFVNPTANFVMPTYDRRLKMVPTEADIKKLLAQPEVRLMVGIRDRAIIEVAYGTGARLNELVRMNLFSVDRSQRAVRVMGKGSKERILPLGKHAMYWIETYLRHSRPRFKIDPDQQALWVGVRGKRLSDQAIQSMLQMYSAKAGFKPAISAHCLRRACATHMLRRGAHPVQIQMLLGHSTLENLSQYLKVTITDMQKAYERSNPAK